MDIRGRFPASRRLLAAGVAFGVVLGLQAGEARADAIASFLIKNVPVPTPRPPHVASGAVPLLAAVEERDQTNVGSVAAIGSMLQPSTGPVASSRRADVAPINGNLKAGLDALAGRDAKKALAIRAGLRPGSIERKVLAWAIALSGQPGIPSGEIAAIVADLPDWPGQKTMRINSERALASEKPSAAAVIKAFGNSRPESLDGAIELAKANLANGNAKAARAAIARFWHTETLSDKDTKRVLDEVGKALTRDDHRARMAMLFYRERVKAAMALADRAGRPNLAKAWAAVIGNDANAAKLLDAVPAGERDAGHLFARIKHHRRAGNYEEAARLFASAPKDPAALVNPDEWWVERRLVSRGLLDEGKAAAAYKVAAGHAAESPAMQAEAEFHAGWYALRFLNDPRRAAPHFERIVRLSSTPISRARGYYWLGRATGGAQGQRHYRSAALHQGTYYGQLAAQALGIRRLAISNPKPGEAERARFAANELVRAIELLEAAGHGGRADIIYRELAERLNSAGELALLAARAERRGNNPLALQIGKIAHGRGLEVDTLSWPMGAIPTNAKIDGAGRALAYAIARQESAFNVGAVSPADARGLLQLLPGTAKQMAKKTGQKYSAQRLVTDAAYNATLGAAYLSEQLDSFGNSYILTFVGYNAGPRRARDWVATYGDPRGRPIEEVIDWVERIPFTETRNYVQRVMENYQVYKARIANAPLDIEGDLRHGRR